MKEEKEDRFASIMKFCKPTASQEAKFRNCPLVRESENFVDSNPEPFSSSPEPTPSEPTRILMVSPPDSGNSVDQNSPRENDAIFHTPPEEQNLDESSSDGARTVNLGDRFDGQKIIRVYEGESDDELTSKKIRVSEEELDGETVPIGETEMITTESDGNEDLKINTEVVDLVSTESGEEMTTVDLVEDSLEKIDEESVVRGDKEEEKGKFVETELVVEKLIHELDAGNENDGLMKKSEDMENVTVNKGERLCKNVDSYGSLGSGKVVGNGCVGMREESGVDGDEEFANVTIDEKTSKDRCEDGDLRRGSKNIEEIDKFRYVSGGEVGSGKKTRGGGVGRRRELPLSMKGKERNVGGGDVAVDTVGNMNGFLKDCLNVFNVVVGGDADSGCEDVDFLETARRRGLTFPRPRWWPPEGDDEQ